MKSPPDLGNVVPSSAIQSAPSMEITPQAIHTTRAHPTDSPVLARIPFGEMKMPLPMMFPTTKPTQDQRPSWRFNTTTSDDIAGRV